MLTKSYFNQIPDSLSSEDEHLQITVPSKSIHTHESIQNHKVQFIYWKYLWQTSTN